MDGMNLIDSSLLNAKTGAIPPAPGEAMGVEQRTNAGET